LHRGEPLACLDGPPLVTFGVRSALPVDLVEVDTLHPPGSPGIPGATEEVVSRCNRRSRHDHRKNQRADVRKRLIVANGCESSNGLA